MLLFLISKIFLNNATKPNNAWKPKFVFVTLICKLQTGWLFVKIKLTYNAIFSEQRKKFKLCTLILNWQCDEMNEIIYVTVL